MPTDIASVLPGKSETGAQTAKDDLVELRAIGGASAALPLFVKRSVVDWHLLFSELVTWLHNKQSEKNAALYEDALRRESAGFPPRWQ